MTRVIITLLWLCQPFYLSAAEIGFSEPELLGSRVARSKVVIVHDPGATQYFMPRDEVVVGMVNRAVMAFTGQSTVAAAWRTLVTPQDVVGIKVHSLPGSQSGTRPAVARAVILGLLDAGVSRSGIVVWDRRLEDLQTAGFADLARSLGVRIAGAANVGFDPAEAYSNPVLGHLVYGDLEFGRAYSGNDTNLVAGRASHFTRLLTGTLTRLINIAPLLNHNEAGVSGILYSVASASTDNFFRFETNPNLIAEAVPEIFGNTNIADRVALNIVDAMIGQFEGQKRSQLNYAETPNELWFSSDPVALDVLAMQELNRFRVKSGWPAVTNRSEIFRNAHYLELGTDDPGQIEVLRLK